MVRRKKRKIHKKRKTKSLLKTKSFWGFLFFLFLGGGFFYLLFLSPYFQLENTYISGAQTISEENLLNEFTEKATISLNMFGEINSQSIFIPSQGQISSILEQFPEIEDLQVKKNFFTQEITLEVSEKKPICVWCYNNNCVLLDKKASYIKEYTTEKGFIEVKEFDKYEEGLALWSEKTKQEFLNILLRIYKNNAEITYFEVYSDKFFAKYKGIDLIFDPKEDINWQIEKMNIILTKLEETLQNIQYIDLRFGEQAIVK